MNDPESRNAFLGSMPVPRLLARLSTPIIIAMIVNGLYNVVDAIFVGRFVGKYAIGALSVVYGFQVFRNALGTMIGVGAASIISRRLGAGSGENANRCAGVAISIAAVSGVVVTILSYGFPDDLLRLFGATPGIIGYARDYLDIVLINTILLVPAFASFDLMRAEGRTEQLMKLGLIGAALNIGLDALLIAGLNMGIKGAAAATVISQCFVTLLIVRFFLSRKSTLKFRWSHFAPDGVLAKRIVALGAPVFSRLAGFSLTVIAINHSLRTYGSHEADLAISAYGVIVRIIVFGSLPIFGMMQAIQPVVGYNYGAGRLDRAKKALKLAVVVAMAYGGVVLLAGSAASEYIVQLFNPDPALVEVASGGLGVVLLAFPVMGVCMMGSAFFQALGEALPALLLFLSRQIFFLIPLALLLPKYFGVPGVWAAIPMADLLAALVAMSWLAAAFGKIQWKTAGQTGQPAAKEVQFPPLAAAKKK